MARSDLSLGALHKQASWFNDAENHLADTIVSLNDQRTAAHMDIADGCENRIRFLMAAETLEGMAGNPAHAELLKIAGTLREGAALEHVQIVRNEAAVAALSIVIGMLQGLVSGISRARKLASTMARAVSQFFAS